ncbi:hypothetical protein Nham_4272 (plasmid) [Nitrobacter hamburgensis X14]|uniref:Uncharacterized protein n=1 Tax=Nitrobacter hamburgensis (strain DSM 10229 / NCIMB 13809 / X14) TaxID=323097 RepID=Q1QFW9_NITHX|nr:hypothetical protein [Nitrobacter hamburgensis]ABE64878.1 hypothetical protein Nham_4272 [Nitrobacter hamburgensis X14]
MTDPASAQKPGRPPLPRDAFRAHRVNTSAPDTLAAKPVVVTPTYEDQVITPAAHSTSTDGASPRKQPRPQKARDRNPFDAYGERSSSRPYALRLPDAIDLVVRQMAAEERTHPLRIIDRILYDHLKRIGRLPPSREP